MFSPIHPAGIAGFLLEAIRDKAIRTETAGRRTPHYNTNKIQGLYRNKKTLNRHYAVGEDSMAVRILTRVTPRPRSTVGRGLRNPKENNSELLAYVSSICASDIERSRESVMIGVQVKETSTPCPDSLTGKHHRIIRYYNGKFTTHACKCVNWEIISTLTPEYREWKKNRIAYYSRSMIAEVR